MNDAGNAPLAKQAYVGIQGRSQGRNLLAEDGSAMDWAVFNLATERVVRPPLAGGHDVAMRVEKNRFAWTVVAAHHEIGHALQASRSVRGMLAAIPLAKR